MTTTNRARRKLGSEVRPARAEDRQAAVRVLALAFWNDPFIVHFYPDPVIRARRVNRFFDLLWRLNFPLGHVAIAGDCEAVALWRPPGLWRVPRFTMLAHLPHMAAAYGSSTGRVFRCLACMERHHPTEPHWYLMTLGVVPDAQGRGLGGALVRAGLARCDADGLPAYLESGTAANIPFYEGLGFQLLGEVAVHDGPPFYPMRRPPSGRPAGGEQRL